MIHDNFKVRFWKPPNYFHIEGYNHIVLRNWTYRLCKKSFDHFIVISFITSAITSFCYGFVNINLLNSRNHRLLLTLKQLYLDQSIFSNCRYICSHVFINKNWNVHGNRRSLFVFETTRMIQCNLNPLNVCLRIEVNGKLSPSSFLSE